MSRTLDYLIPHNDKYFHQKLYDFRIRPHGIVFCYSQNYLTSLSILTHNIFKSYTIGDVYIENIPDNVFIELMIKFGENKCITLAQIKEILISNKCAPILTESREKEWDTITYSKWIVLKKDQNPNNLN